MVDVDQMKDLVRFSHRLQTMGINGLSQEKFIEQLLSFKNKFKIRLFYEGPTIATKIVIVEIRQWPNSKKFFEPEDLERLLEMNGMDYIRFKHLGNPFFKRHLKENHLQKAKLEYQNYVLTNEKACQEFEKLYKLFKYRKIYCLICYCQSKDCHRYWLKELLINKKRKDIGLNLNTNLIKNQDITPMEVKSNV